MQFHTYMINCLGNITSEIHGYEYYTCASAVGFLRPGCVYKFDN